MKKKLKKYLIAFDYWRLVLGCKHFDAEYYRTQINPKVRWVPKIILKIHFLIRGDFSGLHPFNGFSNEIYAKMCSDVIGIYRPFYHFLRFGSSEKRLYGYLNKSTHNQFTDGSEYRRVGIGRHEKVYDFAVVLHLYYTEMWPYFWRLIKNSSINFDVFVTLPYLDGDNKSIVDDIKLDCPNAFIIPVPNKGRDILPFVYLVNSGVLDNYNAVLKLHTKKSPHRRDGAEWRENLVSQILNTVDMQENLNKFVHDKDLAIWVSDSNLVDGSDYVGMNSTRLVELLARCELHDTTSYSFPAGSIYWIKPYLLKLIKIFRLSPKDFEAEAGQLDGTTAHAVERLIGLVACRSGQKMCTTTDLRNRNLVAETYVKPYISAFYLPQFHPIKENDGWWGEGFTEWTNVVTAPKNFDSHIQPYLPSALGYYDLRLLDVMEKQAKLAKTCGVDAFCVYFYWFGGRRLLNYPIDNLLSSDAYVDFPFYFCWANESWRRNWDGQSGTVLIEQSYSEGFELELARDLYAYFIDHRYQKPDGLRPRILIYKIADLPNPKINISNFRNACRSLGIGEVEVGAVLFNDESTLFQDSELIDFWVEMPPHRLIGESDWLGSSGDHENLLGKLNVNAQFEGGIYCYDRIVSNSLDVNYRETLPQNTIAGVMPSWDNTARRKNSSHIAYGGNPINFHYWLTKIRDTVISKSYRNELMVNAWNEWAEKAVLEPSMQFGFLNSESLQRVFKDQ